ncbi:Na/Pi cotransporter family protein [Pararhizobium mangrovi]|uniref:Na/Pi cotransporter family protein n=1 Tax=Pararhizobium mangrovi TaxID=2590452 RepID=A0A506U790_9HYPH|nr:Na/Pi cotransporter family protein [Pararhizobium mangrovi]TPW30282.1 Na/Pi cotransporter family protein [Pararhizobium mangrovi]
MTGSVLLLHMAGAVALLLYATRMVRTGVERAYGTALRRNLRGAMDNPLLATLTGLALAVALQSSTAVTLLVGSFSGTGIVTGLSGIMAVRGAEVGSALLVRLLSLNLTLLVPICLLVGTTTFLATERRRWRQMGRILIGIGLLVLSLRMMGEASLPLRNSSVLPLVIGYLSGDPVTAFLLAAVVTYLFHSSIAAVLILVALASRGVISPDLGVVMVLGVNLGSSFIAPILTRASPPAFRVVPVANLLVRGLGSILVLLVYLLADPSIALLGTTTSGQIIHAHILFNVLVLIVGLPLSRLILRASEAIVAMQGSQQEEGKVGPPPIEESSALNAGALDQPSQALANATREAVRMCETVEVMIERIIRLYEHADQSEIDQLADLDDDLDRRHAAIKLYLARITEKRMTDDEARTCQDLLGACVKLEHVGDIVTRNMLAHVQKKLDRGVDFTEEGWRELSDFHAAVAANARMAFNLLVTGDAETARQLVMEKDHLRAVERETSNRHFDRLRRGTERSLETSTIHLDTIRDLKQINSLLATIAYPFLEREGALSTTRLRNTA